MSFVNFGENIKFLLSFRNILMQIAKTKLLAP